MNFDIKKSTKILNVYKNSNNSNGSPGSNIFENSYRFYEISQSSLTPSEEDQIYTSYKNLKRQIRDDTFYTLINGEHPSDSPEYTGGFGVKPPKK